MDDQTLDRFEALNLKTSQKQTEKKGRGKARRKKDARQKVEGDQKHSTLPDVASGQSFLHTSRQAPPKHGISSQQLPTKSRGCVSTNRSHDEARVSDDTTVDGSRYRANRGPVTRSQTVDSLQQRPSHRFNKVDGVSVQPQHHILRPSAPPLLPHRRPSEVGQCAINPLAQGQKPSLSVSYPSSQFPFRTDKTYRSITPAPADCTLPVRSKAQASVPSSSVKASSSSNTIRKVDYTKKAWLNKERAPRIQHPLQKGDKTDAMIHLPEPVPTKPYISCAETAATQLLLPQSLLVVLDLNGTLLYRTSRATNFVSRRGLERFLDYCFANHSVLIWSSARPPNVAGVCEKLFTSVQRGLLLGQWSRDTLGLTKDQYHQRVQVYKRLDTVWKNAAIQSRHPKVPEGGSWGQHNTVLIDDSALKAAAQPFNLIEVPTFVGDKDPAEATTEALAQVISKLEELRAWDNVSSVIRAERTGQEHDNKRDA